MGLTVRKVQAGAEDRIRSLVTEHAESLEPGLSVLETSLRLGRTTIDVVALDAKQTLVLVVAADVADEKMLVSTLDAYVWCLAFPENLQRLHPTVSIATKRPPRVIFVAERIPDTFVDLVERLSVVPVECQELSAPSPAVAPTVRVMPVAPASTAAPSRRIGPVPVTAGFDAGVASQWESFLAEGAATNGHANGHSNGHANGSLSRPAPIAAPGPAQPVPSPAAPPAAPQPAAAQPAPAAPAAEPEAPADPEAPGVNHPALESLKFPKGGVSRQWQDFLDQLAAASK
ncbi:MAG TPA: hypothetical protein VID04_10820 [Methylomirabilota bacterium]|jgi:hypothetical protein